MKAIGNWVLIEIGKEKTSGGIISSANNKGKVIHCSCDKNLNGRLVYFSNRNEYNSVGEYIAVPYENIMAVEKIK